LDSVETDASFGGDVVVGLLFILQSLRSKLQSCFWLRFWDA